jgi:hypothetical protein
LRAVVPNAKIAGPVSNIMGSLGVELPDDADKVAEAAAAAPKDA